MHSPTNILFIYITEPGHVHNYHYACMQLMDKLWHTSTIIKLCASGWNAESSMAISSSTKLSAEAYSNCVARHTPIWPIATTVVHTFSHITGQYFTIIIIEIYKDYDCDVTKIPVYLNF